MADGRRDVVEEPPGPPDLPPELEQLVAELPAAAPPPPEAEADRKPEIAPLRLVPGRASKSEGLIPASAPRTVHEDLSAFLARTAKLPPIDWLVPDLIPNVGTCMWHGQPRDFKSWCGLEILLALASGRNAFEDYRFRVTDRVRTIYFTEEDNERVIRDRIEKLLRDRARPEPGWFSLVVRKSLSFDVDDSQKVILETLRRSQAAVAGFDPLRSYTKDADRGPAEFTDVRRFFARAQNETPTRTLLVIHHDVKPPAWATGRRPEERTRSHDASGGGIFAFSECPVAFRKTAWNKVKVTPEDYKYRTDPLAFEVTFHTEEVYDDEGIPLFGDWVHPKSDSKVEAEIDDVRRQEDVLRWLTERAIQAGDEAGRWVVSTEVSLGTEIRKGPATDTVLERLLRQGLVDHLSGDNPGDRPKIKALGRKPNAKLWSVSHSEEDRRRGNGEEEEG